MAVSLYLKLEEVEVEVEEYHEKGRAYKNYRYMGETLQHDNGVFRHEMYEAQRPLDPKFEKKVFKVVIRDWLPHRPVREQGVYTDTQTKVEAELTYASRSGADGYEVVITASSVATASEFLRQIRAGEIRPTRSYEDPQGGPSYAELAAEIQGLRDRSVGLGNQLDIYKGYYRETVGRLSTMSAENIALHRQLDAAQTRIAELEGQEDEPMSWWRRILDAINSIGAPLEH